MDSKRIKNLFAALGVGVVAVLAFAWYEPTLFWQFSDHIADTGDAVLNYWILNNGVKKILAFDLLHFWDSNQFYPFGRTLALGDHLFFHALVIAPFYQMGMSLLSLQNLSTALFFAANILIFYLCLTRLGAARAAAFLGAVIFGVHFMRFARMPQIQMLHTYWYPLMFFCGVKFFREGRLLYLSGFCLALIGLALSSPYLLVFSFPALIILAGFCSWKYIWVERSFQRLGKAVIIAAAALLVIGVFYYPYYLAKINYDLQRAAGIQAEYAARWHSFFSYADVWLPSYLFGTQGRDVLEGNAYISLSTWLALITAFLFVARDRGHGHRWEFFLLSLAFVYFLGAMGPRGPEIFDLQVWKAFARLPGFEGIRSPGRLVYLFFFFLALFLTSTLSSALERSAKKKTLSAWLCFLGAFHLFEMRLADVRRPYLDPKPFPELVAFLERQDKKSATLFQPIREPSPKDLLWAAETPNPVVNGVAGAFVPITQHVILPALQDCYHTNCLEMLRRTGIKYIVAERDHLKELSPKGAEFLSNETYFRRLFSEATFDLYEFTGYQSREGLYESNEEYLQAQDLNLPKDCEIPKILGASHNQEDLARIFDSDFATGWTAAKVQDDDVWIDLEAARPPKNIVLFYKAVEDDRVNLDRSKFLRRLWLFELEDYPGAERKEIDFALRIGLDDQERLVQVIDLPDPKGKRLRINARDTPWVVARWEPQEIRVCY